MKTYLLKVLVPSIVVGAALSYASSALGQAPAAATPSASAPAVQPGPMTVHHEDRTGKAPHHADMKAECQSMMTRKQEMQAKLAAMDATLDRLVAEMNAAKGSAAVDALEKPTVAVINELVNDRKASRMMMMDLQSEMMAHMMRHMRSPKGAMGCPMMKSAPAPEPGQATKTPGI